MSQTPAVAESNNAVVPQTQPQPAKLDIVTRDLFNVSAFDNSPEIAKAFGLKPVKSKGVLVGGSMELIGKKELAKALNLEGKANADALAGKVREIKAEAMTAVKKHIAGLSPDWVLHKFTTRTLSDGTKQQTMVTREMPQNNRAMFIKYAKAMGLSDEQIEAMIKGEAKPLTIETTVTTAQPAAAPALAKK